MTPFPTETFYHGRGLRRVRFIFFTKDPDIHISYFALFSISFKFEEVVSPIDDTEDRIESFFAFSESKRSSKLSHKESSSTNASVLKDEEP